MKFKPGDPVWVHLRSTWSAHFGVSLPDGQFPGRVLDVLSGVPAYVIECDALPPCPYGPNWIALGTILSPRHDGDDSALPSKWADVPWFKPDQNWAPREKRKRETDQPIEVTT